MKRPRRHPKIPILIRLTKKQRKEFRQWIKAIEKERLNINNP